MNKHSKIYIAGHRGLVGSAIVRKLQQEGYDNLLMKTHSELDLMNQSDVQDFFESEKPDYVILAAAKVGGINANEIYPVDFLYDNLQIQNNVIYNAYKTGVKKLLFLGSSCIYPRECPQPIKEKYLLSGKLESTNEPYALAKIAGIKLCQSFNRQYGTNFIAAMPTNLYGPGDNFDLETSHVLPALIRRLHEAKIQNKDIVTLWGTGTPKREFLYVDDLADACLFLMKNFDPTKEQNKKGEIYFNIGVGKDLTILELANQIKDIVGFEGDIRWDKTKPDGTVQKLLNVDRMKNLGWEYKIDLKEGLEQTYDWYEGQV